MPSPTSGRKVARCSAPGCKKQVQTRKLCKAHGGGVRCQGLNCAKLAQSRGLCVAHGGGRRCGFEGCNKLAQYKGLCLSHGGGRRCRVIGCHKFVQIRGCCKAHARRLIEEATRGSSAATVVYPIPAASKFDVSFTGRLHEQRTRFPVKQETLSIPISQDPAVRVFTAPRSFSTIGSSGLYKQSSILPVGSFARITTPELVQHRTNQYIDSRFP
ncbi:hypothetical protein F441_03815 [Phytophthora nicotianae CJ01A1]|uniref:WRKY19-like zinc finger domain-containing protein n=2 Tax=Phytophthora nicotianae TaxID=4792 RepID=W2XM24_PHYNI|nr:hypothetical protein F441_03815 [Phytophthora nicotianae CJ01A1]KUF83390.1 WRKY transcription factor 19 [Phytophthora nicotianae]